MSISISWQGPPCVMLDGQRVIFPFRKAEALFYYLAVEKRATRDRLLNLLWADMDDVSARKNLRNGLYVIRKLIGEDVLQTPSREMVEWNDAHPIEDIMGRGEFLEGFVLKDAEGYDNWLDTQRQSRRELEREALAHAIQEDETGEARREALKRLIELDEYDEEPYRLLMQSYGESGQVHRALELYQDLSRKLRADLEIQPEEQTTALYENLLRLKTKLQEANKAEGRYFFGRELELSHLNGCLSRFLLGEGGTSVLVHGEAGIGKSELLRQFFLTADIGESLLFTASCYATEESAYYRPWESVYRDLRGHISESAPDEDILPGERELLELLCKLAEKRRIVICFEDIHWADPMSLNLMTRLLLKDQNRRILMVMTSRTGTWQDLGQLLTEGRRENLLSCIELRRFSADQTMDFAKGYLKNPLSKDTINNLYRETEGNTFFVVEYLNHVKKQGTPGMITPRMQDVLLSRLVKIRPESLKLLDLLSVFRDRVPLGVLSEISGREEMELIDLLDELYRADLMKESLGADGDVELTFTHQKLRDFVFERLSESKRRILFRRIGEVLSARYQEMGKTRWDLLDYYFEKAGERSKALTCGLNNLYGYLESAYETFPVLPGREDPNYEKFFSEEELGLELKRLEERLKALEKREGLERCRAQRLQWLHMDARYHIKIGSYVQGLKALEELKRQAASFGEIKWQVKAGFQEIFYCINAHRTAQMELVVDETLELAESAGMEMETAVLMRLKGFQRILVGSYEDGEIFLTDALRRFQKFNEPQRYALNIAAVYYYLGEGRRYRGQWKEAQGYYTEAIRLCQDIGEEGRLTIFYTQSGHGAYESGDFKQAEVYFKQALKLYERYDFRWGQSTVCGFQSLIRFRQGKIQEAIALLEEAMHRAKRLGNPYEMGLCNRVRAEIRMLCKAADAGNPLVKKLSALADEKKDIPSEPLEDRCFEIDVTEKIRQLLKDR